MKESTIVATAVLFLLAGYDTTATTLSFTAFQLAAHPGHQRRIRRELQNIVKEHGGLTYQALVEAKLLDAAISGDTSLHSPALCWCTVWVFTIRAASLSVLPAVLKSSPYSSTIGKM